LKAATSSPQAKVWIALTRQRFESGDFVAAVQSLDCADVSAL